MTRLRSHLRSFVWLALLAMAALAFGPSVSRALGAEAMASSSTHAICSGVRSPAAMAMQMHGEMQMQMPAADPSRHDDGPAPSHHSSNLLDCCALCAIAASPMAILAFALPEWQPNAVTTPFRGGASGATPHQRAQWPSAAPRGPPSLA